MATSICCFSKTPQVRAVNDKPFSAMVTVSFRLLSLSTFADSRMMINLVLLHATAYVLCSDTSLHVRFGIILTDVWNSRSDKGSNKSLAVTNGLICVDGV